MIDFGAATSFIAPVGRGMTTEIAASVLIGLAAFEASEGRATEWLEHMVPRAS